MDFADNCFFIINDLKKTISIVNFRNEIMIQYLSFFEIVSSKEQ